MSNQIAKIDRENDIRYAIPQAMCIWKISSAGWSVCLVDLMAWRRRWLLFNETESEFWVGRFRRVDCF